MLIPTTLLVSQWCLLKVQLLPIQTASAVTAFSLGHDILCQTSPGASWGASFDLLCSVHGAFGRYFAITSELLLRSVAQLKAWQVKLRTQIAFCCSTSASYAGRDFKEWFGGHIYFYFGAWLWAFGNWWFQTYCSKLLRVTPMLFLGVAAFWLNRME